MVIVAPCVASNPAARRVIALNRLRLRPVVNHRGTDYGANSRQQRANVTALGTLHVPHFALKTLVQPPEILLLVPFRKRYRRNPAKVKPDPFRCLPKPEFKFHPCNYFA